MLLDESGPSSSVGSDLRWVRALVLLNRYSLHISAAVESVLGPGSSGNHEVQVLTHLHAAGPSRPSDLLAVTGLSRTGVARVVARVESLGLVSRTQGDTDRRTVVAALTRAGRRRMSELERVLDACFERTRPFARELVETLCPGRWSDQARARRTVLETAGRMGTAGAAYVSAVEADLGRSNLRQRAALCLIAESGGARPTQLAGALSMTSGGLNYLITRLEVDGLVVRRYGVEPEDRRAVLVELTETGRQQTVRMARALAANAGPICDALRDTLAPRPTGAMQG